MAKPSPEAVADLVADLKRRCELLGGDNNPHYNPVPYILFLFDRIAELQLRVTELEVSHDRPLSR